jgi:hypothetical protein
MSDDRLQKTIASIRASDKMKIESASSLESSTRTSAPAGLKAVAQLEADVAAGAVGVGEISKGFGLQTKKPDGSRLKLDDPELDPIWERTRDSSFPCSFTADPQNSSSPSTTPTNGGSDVVVWRPPVSPDRCRPSRR